MAPSTTTEPTSHQPNRRRAERNVGRIEEIQGVVIEAVFPDRLPEINHAITIAASGGEPRGGGPRHQRRRRGGAARMRGPAAPRRRPRARRGDGHDRRSGARGWRCSTPAVRSRSRSARRRSGASSTCSASRSTSASRLPADVERRGIHQEAPRAEDLTPTTEMFETGIKVDRPARPLRQGRQGRAVRRRRRRQDGADPGADPQPRQGARRAVGVLRRGRALARGQRPVAGDEGVGRPRQDDARVRPDERAPGSPHAGRAVGSDDGRILPRPGPGRAAVHRQHLPLRPGRLRGLGAARADALAGRLPADAGDRDGPAAGADHLDQAAAR